MSPEISPPSSWTNHGRCLFGVEENGGLLPANHKKHVHDGEAMLWKMKQNYGDKFVKNQFSKIVCALETNFSVLWQITSVIIIFPYSSQIDGAWFTSQHNWPGWYLTNILQVFPIKKTNRVPKRLLHQLKHWLFHQIWTELSKDLQTQFAKNYTFSTFSSSGVVASPYLPLSLALFAQRKALVHWSKPSIWKHFWDSKTLPFLYLAPSDPLVPA